MFKPPKEASDCEIEQICRLLNQKLGFNYTLQKKYLVQSRLNKRLIELNMDSYQAYLERLERDQSEFNKLVSLITTNVTSFFREPYQFQVLQDELLPEILAGNQKTRKLRCWSAGCSSGEEAYTLAIVIKESLGANWDLRILASDISIVKLKEGMAGIYPLERLEGIPRKLRQKYFMPLASQPDYFQIKPDLRELVHFRKINLIDKLDVPEHIKFDLIFCRNVFIYLARDSQRKVIQGFYDYLKPGGYLFLGHSESLNFTDPNWTFVKRGIYRKK